jgi:hypothetical protein
MRPRAGTATLVAPALAQLQDVEVALRLGAVPRRRCHATMERDDGELRRLAMT